MINSCLYRAVIVCSDKFGFFLYPINQLELTGSAAATFFGAASLLLPVSAWNSFLNTISCSAYWWRSG